MIAPGLALAQEDSARQLLGRAIELQKSGHFAEAIDAYREFLKTYPQAAPIRSNLGAALIHEGRYPEAIEEYTLALHADPSNFGIRFNLALAYYKQGETEKALKEFESVDAAIPQDDPNRGRLVLLIAECYLREGNDGRVIALLDPVASTGTEEQAVDYLLGTALLHVGQIDRGAPLIQKLLQHGETAEAHMLLAYTQLQAHDKAKSMAEVERAIELNPNLPEAYSLRGRLAYLMSNLQEAEASFNKALQLDPNDFEALLWQGTLLRQEGQLQESEKNLSHALQLQPGDIRCRFQFARLRSDEGDDQTAAQLLEKLIQDAPEYTEAHRTLATIYFRLGRPDDGRRERKIAEEMNAAIEKQSQEQGRKITK
jgi:tetratricopeptide (TPR) repeat protein